MRVVEPTLKIGTFYFGGNLGTFYLARQTFSARGLCPKPQILALSRQDFLDREMSCAHTPGIPAL